LAAAILDAMADDPPDATHPDRYKWPIVAHADVENVDCCGCIWPVIRGDEAAIT
jgi:hypothetical protein